MKNKKILGNFWIENYVDPKSGICSLCGNTGKIITTPKSPLGKQLGKFENYCICPNGRAMNEQN